MYGKISDADAARMRAETEQLSRPRRRGRGKANVGRIEDLFAFVRDTAPGRRRGPPPADMGSRHITRREASVLQLLAQGLHDREIAELLGITVGTAKIYASKLYAKLAVNGRYQAGLWAREHAEMLALAAAG